MLSASVSICGLFDIPIILIATIIEAHVMNSYRNLRIPPKNGEYA